MDPTITDVLSFLEQLDDEIDDLEDSFEPILEAGLSDTASKLPLLDKAKLYILATYAVESILFSYLRLNGVKAREHPVFKELTRVKQYFDKLKAAENPVSRPGLTLDKNAAGRFIKAGLTGNDKVDLERAERLAKERAKAHIRFNDPEAKAKEKPAIAKFVSPSSDSSGESSSEEEEPPKVPEKTPVKPSKKRKADALTFESISEVKESAPSSQAEQSKSARKKKKANKKKAQRKSKE